MASPLDYRESYYTTSEQLKSEQFYNYPRPYEHTSPYHAPESPGNPVIRGSLLKLSASLVRHIPGLAGVFYQNAGFGRLKENRAANELYATYDPVVIPVRRDADEPASVYTDPKLLPQPKSELPGTFYSILDYHRDYASGRTTPLDVVDAILPLIRRDVDEPSIHSKAWLDTNVDLVRTAAAASTKRWKEGRPFGVLDGVPLGVKDEVDLKGYFKKSMGSTLDFWNKLDQTSWCVAKWEEQGAIVLGKLNMHEIGMDTSNNNPHYGTPVNPYNDTYYPGGSSGGSASAVASGIIPFALGCDGGGSIRLPSSWCGIYGLKTTHGWVSTRPYDSPAKSTGVAGPMAANMIDLEVAWRVMSQPDPEDAISRQFPSPSKLDNSSPKRLGIYKNWFELADPGVRDTSQKAIDYYTSKLNYEIVDITLPYIKEAQMAHAITILTEATSNMTAHEIRKLTAPNAILVQVGQQTSVADFLAAQKFRTMVMEHMAFLFKKYPGLIVVSPTTPNAGWPIHPGDAKFGASNGDQSLKNMMYVWLANFCGLPSISLPVGYVKPVQGEGEVPIGLMGTGEWGAEDQLIGFGYEGEEWLKEGCKGGRFRPRGWVDVMNLVPQVEKGLPVVA